MQDWAAGAAGGPRRWEGPVWVDAGAATLKERVDQVGPFAPAARVVGKASFSIVTAILSCLP